MPAGFPGATPAQNLAGPTQGPLVVFDGLSGPKNSPLDARTITGWTATGPTYANDPNNISTGALATGIGFGSPPIFGTAAVNGRFAGGNFGDDYKVGLSAIGTLNASNVVPAVTPDATDSRYVYIGGGRTNIVANVPTNVPYTAGFQPCAGGNTFGRDQGAGAAKTGFPMKSVTGAAIAGAVIETGFSNASGVALVAGQSTFGLGAAQAAPAEAEEEPVP